MKKLLVFFLAILFLSGCGSKGNQVSEEIPLQTEAVWIPTYPDVPDPEISPLTQEEWTEMAYPWGTFYWNVKNGRASDIVNDDGWHISYDGEFFYIKKGSESYSYKYFVDASYRGKTTYTVCYILSDDPELTRQQCVNPEQGVVIFEKTPNMNLFSSEGKIPQDIIWLYELEAKSVLEFGKDSVYEIVITKETGSINRYNYTGDLLSETEVLPRGGTLWPLENGGFLWWVNDYPDCDDSLQCYNPDGSLKWEYIFQDESSYYFPVFTEYCNEYYLFGSIREENSDSDLYFCAFTKDGTIRKASRIGGSDFDEIAYVEPQEDGFFIIGRTQSRDGDLPFSPDGFFREFEGTMNTSFEISNMTACDEYSMLHTIPIGYYQGKPAYSVHMSDSDITNHIFNYPEEVMNGSAVFDYKDGYVVVSYHSLEYTSVFWVHPYSNLWADYGQLIYTFYDQEGNVRWKLAEAVVNQ